MDKKKFSLVILSAVFITAVIFFLSSKNNLKPQPVNYTPVPTQKPIDLCTSFPITAGEISCSQSMVIALQKYPGKVDYVRKQEATYRIPPEYKVRATKEMWIIGVTLNSPQYIRSPETPDYTVEIAVDKSDGNILSVREIHDYDIAQ